MNNRFIAKFELNLTKSHSVFICNAGEQVNGKKTSMKKACQS